MGRQMQSRIEIKQVFVMCLWWITRTWQRRDKLGDTASAYELCLWWIMNMWMLGLASCISCIHIIFSLHILSNLFSWSNILQFTCSGSDNKCSMYTSRFRKSHTGCCKTTGKLWQHITETLNGVFLVFLGSFDCQIWAIFHFGTLWA